MKLAIAFLSLVATHCVSAVKHPGQFNEKPDQYLPPIEGPNVAVPVIPYLVSVLDILTSTHICTGSILNQHYVLTAAHCFSDAFSSKREIAKNDIAVLKTIHPIGPTNEVSSVLLPVPGAKVKRGMIATTYGWGSREMNGSTFPIYRTLNMQVIAAKDVPESENTNGWAQLHNTDLLVKPSTDVEKLHYGKSGGPMIVNGRLVGIQSMQVYQGRYLIYMNIHNYIDWIEATIKK